MDQIEYTPASVVWVRHFDLPDYVLTCRIYVECVVGGLPKMSIDLGLRVGNEPDERMIAPKYSGRTPSLLSHQWERVREAMSSAWAELAIPCVCGHAFKAHANRSPHGCCASVGRSCPCDRFRASEPLVDK